MPKDWTIGSNGWVTGKMFGIPVEKNEVKRPGGESYLVLHEDSKLGNLHTSEGSTIDGLIATLKAKGFAGQWCVGQGRIVQTRPVWAQGSLLLGGSATNAPMRMEVEQVGFTKTTGVWTPDVGTFGPMCALAAFYAVEFGIPLKVPVASWKDNGSDLSPAFFGANSRRNQAAAVGLSNLEGWIHHCEVPQNLHADCGTYNREGLFAAAQLLVDSLKGDDWMAEFTEAELDRLKKLAAGDQLVGFRAGMIQGEKKEPLKAPDTGKFAEAGRKLLNP